MSMTVVLGEIADDLKNKLRNIFRESFDKIWHAGAYVEFRSCFEKRLNNDKGASPADTKTEPPVRCRTCHKMLGL
jgi:Iron-sulfur cluster-binding domain